MKNNTPTISDPVPPLIWKLTMIGGGILIVVMLVLTARSIIGLFRSAPPPSDAMQTNAEIVVVQSKPPAGAPLSPASDNSPLSAPDNSKPAASMASRPVQVDVQVEIIRQREKARVETIEALKREAQEQAGASGVPKEALQKLEQSDPIIH